MTCEHVLYAVEPPVAVITINRPERRNALSLEMMRALTARLDDAGCDNAVRAIILAAAGQVFSSGHDLVELRASSLPETRRIFDACTDLMLKIQSVPQPVIAQVQGLATAAGCQLAAACDLVIAAEEASFATPGVRIGLFCSTPMVPLVRAVGRKRAMEMLVTGRAIDARTAADWGLVNRVVPAARLEGETRALAADIARASHLVVGIGKQAFYSQIDLDEPRAYACVKEVMTMNAMAEDAREGIAAFLEKRAPCWKNA